MSSLKQIQANRLNAQKSTGPRSPEGKAAVRFNALKSGIDAQSQVIPGEDPAALALLAAEYHGHYQPATPEVRALVDALVAAEWLQRRFRTLEAQLWQYSIQDLYQQVEGLEVAQAYDRNREVFNRLQRRIDAAERTFQRTLQALQKIEPRAPQPASPDPGPRRIQLVALIAQHHRTDRQELLPGRLAFQLDRDIVADVARQRSLGVFHFADEIDAWRLFFGVNAKKKAPGWTRYPGAA